MNEYGTCCICGEMEGKEVINLIQLDYKNPRKLESGWGCLVCGLDGVGAVAVVCNDCFDPDTVVDDIKYLMDGTTRRCEVPEVSDRVPHQHDYSKHRELDILN